MTPPTKNEHDRRTVNKLRRELGQVILTALQDSHVEDLARNSDGWLWIKRQGQPCKRLEEFPDILTITPDNPVLDGELIIDGSRIHGNLPSKTRRPSFIIRKRPTLIFRLKQQGKTWSVNEHNRSRVDKKESASVPVGN